MAKTRTNMQSPDFPPEILRLRAWTKARGMDMRDLAEATGIPYATVQSYLAADRAMPASALAKFCQAIGVSADLVLFGRLMLDRGILAEAIEVKRIMGVKGLGEGETADLIARLYWRVLTERLPALEPRSGIDKVPLSKIAFASPQKVGRTASDS